MQEFITFHFNVFTIILFSVFVENTQTYKTRIIIIIEVSADEDSTILSLQIGQRILMVFL